MRSLKALVFIALLVSKGLFGQVTNISPFSKLSVGDFQRPAFTQNFAMGGLSYGMQSPFNINPYNPASYSRLFWTSFEAAVMSNNYWLQTENQSQQANVTNFNHLALGFPLAPYWGMAIVIMPVSHVGYDYKTSHRYMAIDSTEVTYNNIFLGSGGLNKVTMGHGFSIKRTFFFGFNFSYYFGDMEYQESIEYTLNDNFNNSGSLQNVETGDIYLDFGAQYRMNLNSKWRIDMGAVFTPTQGLSSKRTDFNFTFSGITGVPRIIDTVSFSENEAFSIVLPPKIGFGVLLNRDDKFKVGLDADYTAWSQSNYNTYTGLEDVYSVKTGLEYTDKEERYILRLGARYANMPLVINNSRANEMSASSGIAFPIRSKDKLSYTVLNIGLEVGQRGKLTDGWLREQFFNVSVGLSLNNKWFIKRVYD